ncbi:uncharacterized protein C10orf95-like [Pongo pygmaeus]|uniref:uncharacterized protein C10orf95-like n=1 Tax=Pongo pygmaeus TaxID=9600 RepID=UPI00300CA9AC
MESLQSPRYFSSNHEEFPDPPRLLHFFTGVLRPCRPHSPLPALGLRQDGERPLSHQVRLPQADPDGGSAPHWAPREAEVESSRKLLCTAGQAPAGLRKTPESSPALRQALPQLGLLSRARSPRPARPGHARPQETPDARGGNRGPQDRDPRAAGSLGGAVSRAAPASAGGDVAAAEDPLCQLRPRSPGRDARGSKYRHQQSQFLRRALRECLFPASVLASVAAGNTWWFLAYTCTISVSASVIALTLPVRLCIQEYYTSFD